MTDFVLPTYAFTLMYGQKLVADVDDGRMCEQPVAGRVMNHAAFVIGHLAWAGDNGVVMLGRPSEIDPVWKTLFSTGAKPSEDRSLYPAKAALLAALEASHGRLAAAWAQATPETLSQPTLERMRRMYATVGQMVAGLMTAHESVHLGQLSAWRRAVGLPSVF